MHRIGADQFPIVQLGASCRADIAVYFANGQFRAVPGTGFEPA
jgi:hypothetical protein